MLSRKHILAGELLFIFSIAISLYLFFTDKVYKFIVLDFLLVKRFFGALFLTGIFLVVPVFILLIVFCAVKLYFYKKHKAGFFVIMNYILSFILLGLCLYSFSYQTNYEKSIKFYGSKEQLMDTLEKKLVERNPDYQLEFINAEVKEGNPIWQGIDGDDSFAKTEFAIKVTSKSAKGIEKMAKYSYMFDGRQLKIIIDCGPDGKCALAPKKNGPIVY